MTLRRPRRRPRYLLEVTPGRQTSFRRFAKAEWPHRFIVGGEDVDWPRSAAWGLAHY